MTLSIPEPFLAILSHSPSDVACCPSRKAYHASREANGTIGKSDLVVMACPSYGLFSLAVVATRRGAGLGGPAQSAALFTSAPIFASSAAVSSFSANEVAHMAPSSRFASSLKPSVAYLALNFLALWKKHTTLPPLLA